MSQELLCRKLKDKITIICRLYIKALLIFGLFSGALIWFSFNHFGDVLLRFKYDTLVTLFSSIQGLILTFLSLVVGSYAIFQALLDDESLKTLVKMKEAKSGISKFTLGNVYFYSYTVVLVITMFFNGIGLILMKSKLFPVLIKEIELKTLNMIYPYFLAIYLTIIIFVFCEFLIFVRNLYDMFKLSSYIRSQENLTTSEKIYLINEYLFNKNKIEYVSGILTTESYNTMKKIMKKDFSLNEAVKFIKETKK